MKSQQSGFAHAFLIIALVVALIGALGFIFWQNFIYKEPVVTKTEVVTKKDVPETKKIETEFIEVNEWGIKLRSSVASDLTYNISSRIGGPENTEYDHLGLEIKSTSVVDKQCMDFGADLYRQKEPTQFQFKKIDTYYYYVAGAPGICSENEKDIKLQKTVLDELRAANVFEL